MKICHQCSAFNLTDYRKAFEVLIELAAAVVGGF